MSDEGVRRERHEHAALLVSRGRDQEAIEIYRALQADDPDDLKAFAALRDLYTRLGRTSDLADQWWLLAEVRAEAGRYLDAHFALQRATSLDPDTHPMGSRRALFRAAARAHIQAGDNEALWCVLRRVDELCDDPYALLRSYVERLEQRPDDAQAAEGLDQVYRFLGWRTNDSDRLAAELREVRRSQDPLAAARAEAGLEGPSGALLDEAFYRELADRCVDGGHTGLAEQMRRKADHAATHKHWVH